jgi:hypothetical protein
MGNEPGEPGPTGTSCIDPNLVRVRLPNADVPGRDPVAEDPFPPDTPDHRLWIRASRHAEERIARLQADWLVWVDAQLHTPRRMSRHVNDQADEFVRQIEEIDVDGLLQFAEHVLERERRVRAFQGN